MIWIRRPKEQGLVTPLSEPAPDFEALEHTYDWAGLWYVRDYDMTWWRPQHYYFRSAITKRVGQNTQQHRGPAIRPDPLRLVGQHLDVPLAVLRSHPDTPNTMPPDREGLWTDTNPAWPQLSIDYQLGRWGLKASWDSFDMDNTERFELVPDFVEGINPEEAEPFDHITPKILKAVVVHVMPQRSA